MRKNYYDIIFKYGSDILSSDGMKLEKSFIQHGQTSVYVHSFMVASLCLYIAESLDIAVDERSLVRGALLHDYFLYDWHIPDKCHRFHGFTHPGRALKNACRDFSLNETEKNMIASHMFPLGISLPMYRESIILCIADKLCASKETLSGLASACFKISLVSRIYSGINVFR